ncbi:MAG TPA: hypothetical protein VL442_07895 [Mucilaginibacter sp.]|nr:hypothetical protein [Mucilaginibacter sp.]
MIRVFLISILLLFIANLSFAQGNLTGRVYENKTRIPIAGVSIQNLKSNVFTVTDKNGLFSIRAHVGDLVTFSSFAYETDTLFVKDLSSIEILMDLKGTNLKGVTIRDQQTRLGGLTAPHTLSPFGGETLVYAKDADGNYKGGLSVNLFDSHSDAKKRAKAVQLGKDEELKQKITRQFSPENLKDYVPLKGQEMTNFIIICTPTIDTYTSPEFNFTAYVDSNYREFMKIPKIRRESKDLTDLHAKPSE